MSEPERPYQPVPPITPDLSLVLWDDLVEEMKRRYTEVVVVAAREIGPNQREIQKAHEGDTLVLIGLLDLVGYDIQERLKLTARRNPEGA